MTEKTGKFWWMPRHSLKTVESKEFADAEVGAYAFVGGYPFACSVTLLAGMKAWCIGRMTNGIAFLNYFMIEHHVRRR